MRIVLTAEETAAQISEFICAAVQRRKEEEGFGGKRIKSTDLDRYSNDRNKLVCVTGGVSYLGRAITERLLIHGYSVRIVVGNQEDVEKVREMDISGGTAAFNDRISSVIADLTDVDSLKEAFDGCCGVFHTSSSIDPAGVAGYSKCMAELEAKVSQAVTEACARTESTSKCVLTSSLLACIWRDGTQSDLSPVVNHNSWSQESLCTERKLWYALGKLKAEKAAWRVAETQGLKLATICPGLITGVDFYKRNPTATKAYLKGAKEMYSNGLLATIDVNRLAKAHVRVFEGLSQTEFGRYICFDSIVGREDAERLGKEIGIQTDKICGDVMETEFPARFVLSDKKLLELMSRTVRSCYHENEYSM